MSTSIQDSPAIQYLSANIPLPELDDTATKKFHLVCGFLMQKKLF